MELDAVFRAIREDELGGIFCVSLRAECMSAVKMILTSKLIGLQQKLNKMSASGIRSD